VWNVVQAAVQTANEGAGAQGQSLPRGSGSGLMQMLPMILGIIALFYFFMIRPQQKQQKERREMLASLSKGDRVVTSGGICGTIVSLKEKSVVLRVSDDDNIKMEFVRGAISQVTSRSGEE